MEKKQIILIGGGGHCVSCIEVVESTNEFEIVGIVDVKEKIGTSILGYKIIASDDEIPKLKKKYDYALITIGQIKTASIRKKLYTSAKEVGFQFPVVIASSAHVSSHCRIGEGTIIMHQSMINANVKIGVNNIINSKALIEHDTELGDFNHISTGAILNGDSSVGNECFVGSNSTFVNGISIDNNIIIGVNSLVNKNLSEQGVYIGNPIRIKR